MPYQVAGRSVLILALLTSPSIAHGPAKWIQDGGYKNALGQLCCGEVDCVELPGSDVQITNTEYIIKSTGERIPINEAQPSPGGYWRCEWGGERKCFFAPLPGS